MTSVNDSSASAAVADNGVEHVTVDDLSLQPADDRSRDNHQQSTATQNSSVESSFKEVGAGDNTTILSEPETFGTRSTVLTSSGEADAANSCTCVASSGCLPAAGTSLSEEIPIVSTTACVAICDSNLSDTDVSQVDTGGQQILPDGKSENNSSVVDDEQEKSEVSIANAPYCAILQSRNDVTFDGSELSETESNVGDGRPRATTGNEEVKIGDLNSDNTDNDEVEDQPGDCTDLSSLDADELRQLAAILFPMLDRASATASTQTTTTTRAAAVDQAVSTTLTTPADDNGEITKESQSQDESPDTDTSSLSLDLDEYYGRSDDEDGGDLTNVELTDKDREVHAAVDISPSLSKGNDDDAKPAVAAESWSRDGNTDCGTFEQPNHLMERRPSGSNREDMTSQNASSNEKPSPSESAAVCNSPAETGTTTLDVVVKEPTSMSSCALSGDTSSTLSCLLPYDATPSCARSSPTPTSHPVRSNDDACFVNEDTKHIDRLIAEVLDTVDGDVTGHMVYDAVSIFERKETPAETGVEESKTLLLVDPAAAATAETFDDEIILSEGVPLPTVVSSTNLPGAAPCHKDCASEKKILTSADVYPVANATTNGATAAEDVVLVSQNEDNDDNEDGDDHLDHDNVRTKKLTRYQRIAVMLKLQKDMATMHLELVRLRDAMRSADQLIQQLMDSIFDESEEND